jgi:ATP-dependent Clp protease ATP-binding subunit ClpC
MIGGALRGVAEGADRMREVFSSQLRGVLDRAQEAARALGQDYVGSEHLMLGLLEADGGGGGPSEAADALRRHEVDVASLRRRLSDALPHGAEPVVVQGSLPLSPKSKQAVDGALTKARSACSDRVSTRLLLLALLDEPETLIRQSLRDEGADLDTLRQLLAEPPAQAEA